MKQFVAQLHDNQHINVRADRMEFQNDIILAYDGDNLVAVVCKEKAISAHISEKSEAEPQVARPEIPEPVKEAPIPKPIPKTVPKPKPAETEYKGFLYIKCEACGKTKGFCAKQPRTKSHCDCGHDTPLQNLKPLYINCKCGETFKYRTNLQDRMTTMDCLKCNSPVDLEYHEKKGLYETIGSREED